MNGSRWLTPVLLLLGGAWACDDGDGGGGAGGADVAVAADVAEPADAGRDGGEAVDAAGDSGGATDAGPPDVAPADAGPADTGGSDAGPGEDGGQAPTVVEEAGDFADCIVGCDREVVGVLLDLAGGAHLALEGQIQEEPHQVGANLVGDVDILGFTAAARSHVRFTIERIDAGGLFAPAVGIHDGFKRLTVAVGEDRTATEVYFPFVMPGMPIYLLVEHRENYFSYPDGPYVGGADYGYRVTWEVQPFQPVELGELAAGGTLEADPAVLEQGAMHAYRFTAQGVEAEAEVAATADAHEDLRLAVAACDTAGGQLGYGPIVGGEEPQVATDWSAVSVEAGEHVLVVLDYNGDGGEGFRYRVTVRER